MPILEKNNNKGEGGGATLSCLQLFDSFESLEKFPSSWEENKIHKTFLEISIENGREMMMLGKFCKLELGFA